MQSNKHGGNIRRLADVAGIDPAGMIDFSANINPMGPPAWLRPVMSASVTSLAHYPDPECEELKEAAAERYAVSVGSVAAGNGSTELIYSIPRLVQPGEVLLPSPCYSDYARASELAGHSVTRLLLPEDHGFACDIQLVRDAFRSPALFFAGHPNNPTGLPLDRHAFLQLAHEHPETLFVIDEAFLDLSTGIETFVNDRPANMMVLVSLTKTFAIPGLRLGVAIGEPDLVRMLEDRQPPWSVNSPAQMVGRAALTDRSFVEASQQYVAERRAELSSMLAALPRVTVYPSVANYLLLRLEGGPVDGPELARRALHQGIAIRVCDNFAPLDHRFVRVAVRTSEENRRLAECLADILQPRRRKTSPRSTPAIMVQGTGSNAGKSILTAALCRILLTEGYRVAPFKAQNMSLNSFVTERGEEMGRAQVVQAQAGRLEPDVRMNPVLLKPNSDTGSQIIVMGKPVASMEVAQYVAYKPVAFAAATKAYDSLAAEFDVMVLEGAGSPGEVNLKRHDIVNMRMAHHAKAPVLLVGDIDRGGVFASFVGTMEVLEEWERALVAGFVVNRFRGDSALLADALEYTRRHTGKSVLGIVPYLSNLGLPEEDSVTFKAFHQPQHERRHEQVTVVLVDLPHISNFTDVDAFKAEPDVALRIARSPMDLDGADTVILPGSKNVPGDLKYLRDVGIADRIIALAVSGQAEVVGICGGFQMLGKRIADPHGIESPGQAVAALGLLDLDTVMAPEKTLTRVHGTHLESGEQVAGYEIHHGETTNNGLHPLLKLQRGELAGARSADGSVWGSYLHGIFDADRFRRWFIDRVRVRKGLDPLGSVQVAYDLEPAFERLAEAVRSSLRMDRIMELLRLP